MEDFSQPSPRRHGQASGTSCAVTSPPRKRMPRGVYLKTQFGLLIHEQLLECLYVKFARRHSLGGSQGGRAAGRVPDGHCRRHRTR